jgi:hypothetical protein
MVPPPPTGFWLAPYVAAGHPSVPMRTQAAWSRQSGQVSTAAPSVKPGADTPPPVPPWHEAQLPL